MMQPFNKGQMMAAQSADVGLALHPYPVIQESGCHLIPTSLQLPLRSLRGLRVQTSEAF